MLKRTWVTFYSLCIQVWIAQVISDLGEGRSEASEVMWLRVGWEGSWEWQNEAAEDAREPCGRQTPASQHWLGQEEDKWAPGKQSLKSEILSGVQDHRS